jgi:hypothetical protein
MRVQMQWFKDGSSDPSSWGSAYLSDGESATVGRETGVDIQLKDISVSRLHAEVYMEDGGVIIKDAGSTNGTILDGKQVVQSRWEPGQSVRIGCYRLSLVALPGALDRQRAGVPQVSRGAPEISPVVPSGSGSVELGDVYQRAKLNDPEAVRQLFMGFLGRNETVINAGYLGALGLIFPEHSFWCITNARICGMVVNASGRVDFTFCFLKAVDVAHFHQPSRVGLWVTIIFYLLIVASIGCGFLAGGVMLGMTPGGLVLFIIGLLVFAAGIYLIPLVTRFYYRFTKSGCAFFTKEHVYMAILADRSNLKAAQSMLRLFEEQKRALGA